MTERARGVPGPLMPLEVRSLAEWEADGVPGLLSVVIPAHNEEGRIAATVRELYARSRRPRIPHEILVVNDNSQRSDRADPQGPPAPKCRRCATSTTRRRTASASRCAPASRPSRATPSPSSWPTRRTRPDDLVAYYRKMQEGYDCVFGSRFMRGATGRRLSLAEAGDEPAGQFLHPRAVLDVVQRRDQRLQDVPALR